MVALCRSSQANSPYISSVCIKLSGVTKCFLTAWNAAKRVVRLCILKHDIICFVNFSLLQILQPLTINYELKKVLTTDNYRPKKIQRYSFLLLPSRFEEREERFDFYMFSLSFSKSR